MEIKDIVQKAHDNAVKHGFWEPPLPFGTAIALIHSELSEALEEERAGRPLVWYHCTEGDPSLPCDPADETECFQYGHEDACQYRNQKPEGVAVELADAVIRIADLRRRGRPSCPSPWPSTAASSVTPWILWTAWRGAGRRSS